MSATARHVAKRLLAQGLVRTGCWDAVLGAWARRDTTVILTYHRVLEKWESTLDYSQPGMVVTVPTFERQLAFLRRHFEIVSLGTLLGEGAGRPPARRPRCVITFDDGWRDNYEFALPILRRHALPAVIFLTTDFIGTERAFWHTELIYLLLHGVPSRFLRDGGPLAAYPPAVRECLRRCAGRVARADDADTLIETVKAASDEDAIQALIDALTRAAGLRRPLFPGRRFFLDWEQVQEMAVSGFEIGSHGCSHRIMTRLASSAASEELVRSKAEIERRLGRVVEHFAFPNEDANETLTGLAARAGYRTACVGGAGAGKTRSGIRALRRVGMHEGVGDDTLLSLRLLRAPKSRLA